MKIRTIEQAAQYMKERDPDTALTKTAIRRLVTSHALPSVRAGVKYLIDLQNLEEYLQGGTTDYTEKNQEVSGGIRKIN